MKLGIVIGSVRENRSSDRMAKWVEKQAREMDGIEPTIIDLLDYPMPLFNEPGSPQYNPDRHIEEHAKAWLDILAEQDAVVLVTPEYNRSYPGALKNAIDYIDFQLKHKPVMLVSHGGTGGAQAVSHLRGVLPEIHAVTTPTAIMVVRMQELIDENGDMSEEARNAPYSQQVRLAKALEDLKWFSDALAAARQ